jgi:hypothetical protein
VRFASLLYNSNQENIFRKLKILADLAWICKKEENLNLKNMAKGIANCKLLNMKLNTAY